jgi:hypothetical protein
MAYIGRQPTVGNFQICDTISVVNGQAAYTMQVGSVNVIPQSANHMIVSLNGTIQKPNSSFTVSGSTITFSSNLATGDVIDFIQILGDVLDLGVPSDATVTNAKISYPLAQSGAVVSSFNRTSSDGNILELQKDGTVVGSIGNKAANIFMTNNSSNNTGFKINPNAITPSTSTGTDRDNAIDLGASGAAYKDLYLGGGLLVGGTGTANKLDDYEEGSWTPVFATGTSGSGYARQDGRYTKIGNKVLFEFDIQGNGLSSTTAQLTISGLPFTSINAAPYGGGVMNYTNGIYTSEQLLFHIGGNDTTMYLYQLTGSNFIGTESANVNKRMIVHGQYTAA